MSSCVFGGWRTSCVTLRSGQEELQVCDTEESVSVMTSCFTCCLCWVSVTWSAPRCLQLCSFTEARFIASLYVHISVWSRWWSPHSGGVGGETIGLLCGELCWLQGIMWPALIQVMFSPSVTPRRRVCVNVLTHSRGVTVAWQSFIQLFNYTSLFLCSCCVTSFRSVCKQCWQACCSLPPPLHPV